MKGKRSRAAVLRQAGRELSVSQSVSQSNWGRRPWSPNGYYVKQRARDRHRSCFMCVFHLFVVMVSSPTHIRTYVRAPSKQHLPIALPLYYYNRHRHHQLHYFIVYVLYVLEQLPVNQGRKKTDLISPNMSSLEEEKNILEMPTPTASEISLALPFRLQQTIFW